MLQEIIQPEMDYVLDEVPLLQAVIIEEMVVIETQGNRYYLDR
jgi:hypothetical protein